MNLVPFFFEYAVLLKNIRKSFGLSKIFEKIRFGILK